MHISLAAEEIFKLFGFSVTNSMIMTWLTMLLLIVVGTLASRKSSLIPNKFQNFFEALLEVIFNFANTILQDRLLTHKVFPIICTLFLLIVFSNWLGLLPGVGTVGFIHESHGETTITPFFRPTNADINATLTWAIISIVTAQVVGVIMLGFISYFTKFINVKALRTKGFQGGIDFSIGILEIFSEVSKVVSFSFRLFGNIFAGEVLLTVIAFLVPFIIPLPFYFLELFVGFIQGVVFVTLTLVFIKIATISHDDHAHSEGHAH